MREELLRKDAEIGNKVSEVTSLTSAVAEKARSELAPGATGKLEQHDLALAQTYAQVSRLAGESEKLSQQVKAKDADLVDGSLVIERLHCAIDALHCEQAQLGKQVAPLGARDKESKSSGFKKSADELINDRNSRSAESGCFAKWNDKDPAKARMYEEYAESSAARRQIRPTENEAR